MNDHKMKMQCMFVHCRHTYSHDMLMKCMFMP